MQFLPLIALYGGIALAQSTTDGASASTVTASRTSRQGSLSATASGSRVTDYIYGAQNTVNLYAASVVSADQGSTILQVVCSTGFLSCYTDVPFTVTKGPSTLHLADAATTGGITAAIDVQCKIAGTTSASCRYSISGRSGGTGASTIISTTYTPSVPAATVIITAGLDKLAAASTIPPNPQSPTPSGNSATRATIMGASAQKGLILAVAGITTMVFGFAVLL